MVNKLSSEKLPSQEYKVVIFIEKRMVDVQGQGTAAHDNGVCVLKTRLVQGCMRETSAASHDEEEGSRSKELAASASQWGTSLCGGCDTC